MSTPEGIKNGTLFPVLRRSPLTKETNVMWLPVTRQQLADYSDRKGKVQDIFPDLTPEQREFIKTGYTPEDWVAMFGPPA